MALKLKDIILEDVHALIRNMTGFQENQENFKSCEQFILSNLLHHRFLSVDGNAIRRSMEGIIMKLQVHCRTKESQELDALVKEFLACTDFKDYSQVDIQWYLLSLILHLGHNPTSASKREDDTSKAPLSLGSNDDHGFDWVSYLREGDEDFHQDYCDISSDEDEVDCMITLRDESLLSSSSFVDVKQTIASSSILPLTQGNTGFGVEETNVKVKQTHMLNAHKILNAECWLQANIQHDWWVKAHINHSPLSNHPFSQTSALCHSGNQEGVKTSILSEHKVVMEIIWFLEAPCDTVVFMKVISDDGLETHFCVRPHVTVPSLMQDVFCSFATYLCAYTDMIEELQTFCSDVRVVSDTKKICGTYKAYALALQHELEPMQEALARLHGRAVRQCDTLTLLILAEELSPWLPIVASLHALHKCAVLDWRKNPNWLCATHLLSVILISLRSADADSGIGFRIFVRTFKVYILIIELWLTRGQLFDEFDEFFIARAEMKRSTLGASFEKRDWEKELIALGRECPEALQVLANSLLKAAQPLNVLCELKRLPELRKHTSRRCSLECLFLQNLINDLENSQSNKVETLKEFREEPDQWWMRLDHFLQPNAEQKKKEKVTPMPFSQNSHIDVKAVMNHLHRLDLPLLVKDFEDLVCDSRINSTSDIQGGEAKALLNKLMLLSHSAVKFMPLESCVERAVLCLSADWEGIAGAIVADILVGERQLLFHIHSAQNVFLLQASHKLQPFLSHVFKVILHRGDLSWMNSHTLSILLQDCMDSDQFSVSVVVGDKDPSNMNALECIDSFRIDYQVDWPLCAIMGEKSQDDLNHIFRLLLKMRWALWILDQLDIKDFRLSDSTVVSKQILLLRHWLYHVVGGSYQFLAGHILNSLRLKFEEDMKSAKDVHSILQVHGRFLDNALHQSLKAKLPDPIKNALFQLVILVENLYSLWNQGVSKVSTRKLSNIEVCYVECHRFLAASLHSLADAEGLNHLVALSDLFNWNIPQNIVQ